LFFFFFFFGVSIFFYFTIGLIWFGVGSDIGSSSLTSGLSPDLFVSALASIEEISFLESLIASLSLA
jgi:hypothetical protein